MSQHPSLSGEQRKFFEMLKKYPKLSEYWSVKKREVDISGLEAGMDSMSEGEAIMAQFFLAIWLKENSGVRFDFVRAAKVLDKKNRELISEWINDPIWP